MIWDARQRRYEDERGRPLSPAQVRRYINEYIEAEQRLITEAARRLTSGSLRPAEFFALMRSKVTAWHSISGVIAYGGEAEMNRERWARINARIFSELSFLAEFQSEAEASFTAAEIVGNKVAQTAAKTFPDAQAQIRARVSRALITAAPSDAVVVAKQVVSEVVGADLAVTVGPEGGFLMGGTIEPRAAMYPNAIWPTHEMETLERERDNGVTLGRRVCEKDGSSCDECVDAATEEFIPLDEIEDIGSLQCMSNCRCEIEFSIGDVQFATSELFGGRIAGQQRYGGDVELN